MHVVSIKRLKECWERHRACESALRAWYREAKGASWKSFNDIKAAHRSADCLPGNRVVFDIKGNAFRLVVKVHYDAGRVYVRFAGTHAEYDKINAETI